MCGIFGMCGHKEAAKFSYLGLYALQHRGEESVGIVAYNGKKLSSHKGMGLLVDIFDERVIQSLKGDIAVGHVRYSTTGSSSIKNIQPFYFDHRKGRIVIAHNGNLINAAGLREVMEDKGSIFQTTMDSEVIAHLLTNCEDKDYKKSVVWALSKLEGAYSLVLMYNDILIGARDPLGFRPLCIGRKDGAYVLASETCALDLIEAEYVRDVEAGEIVFISKGFIESVKPFTLLDRKQLTGFTQKKSALCVFEYIYFARPDSNIFGENVYLTRQRLGKQLAKEYPIKADLVMPVPDSGNYAALGYAQESKIPFEIGLIRNHYVGRTFIQPSQDIRDFNVRVKLNPVREMLRGKRVIVVEDSIVRGTTSRARVKAVRQAGAKEIHMCVSCPPIVSPCFYGIDFPTKEELIAAGHEKDWIRDFIGVDSLNYLSMEGMLKSMPLPKEEFCTACFSGNYPTVLPEGLSKYILEKT